MVPTVAIVTKKLSDKIEIAITDNGNGHPQNIVDKIFQPSSPQNQQEVEQVGIEFKL
jgi:phosphoglycerate-specific signal transduction histidine kinase